MGSRSGVVLVALLMCFFISISAQERGPEVCAKSGCVTGLALPGLNRPYEAFLGLPYARPPTNRYRFQVQILCDFYGKVDSQLADLNILLVSSSPAHVGCHLEWNLRAQ